MKYLIFLLLIINFSNVSAQQSEIRGIVSIQNSETETGERQFVTNAIVEGRYFKTQPALTKDSGQFRLVYVGVQEKSTVYFDVNKPNTDLEVVNIDALKAITGQKEVIKISMASKGQIADYRKKLYEIGRSTAEKNLEHLLGARNNELKILRKNEKVNAEKIKSLEKEIALSEVQRIKINEQAQDLANRYAAINLDDASSLFRDAFNMFQKGNLDSALLVLNELNLANVVFQILQERENVNRLKSEISIRDSLERQRTKEVSEALQFKADLHLTRYEMDSINLCYELLIKLDSSNANYLSRYAYFLAWLNRIKKAKENYLKALAIYRSKMYSDSKTYGFNVANTLNSIGALYINTYDTSSKSYFLEALEIMKRLVVKDQPIYIQTIAGIQNNLGLLYKDENNFAKAESAFTEALKIFKHLDTIYPHSYEPKIELVLNNLGILYKNGNDFKKAENVYLESLKISNRLAKENPTVYEPDVATTLLNLGNLYALYGLKADSLFERALEITRQFAKQNPQTYTPQVADVLVNFGNYYFIKKDSAKANTSFKEALEIRKRLSKENPEAYEPKIVNTLNSIASLYFWHSNYKKSKLYYLEAIDICKRLAKRNKGFIPYYGELLNSLGNVYKNEHDYVNAKIVYKESLEIRKSLAEHDPFTFEPLIQETLDNLLSLPEKSN